MRKVDSVIFLACGVAAILASSGGNWRLFAVMAFTSWVLNESLKDHFRKNSLNKED